MIEVLLDQGLAPRAAVLLVESGINAVHVSEIGLAEAQDDEILQTARDSGRVCITLDHDFHTHLLRVEGLGARGQADLIASLCLQFEAVLTQGAAISADGLSVRVRRLPLK